MPLSKADLTPNVDVTHLHSSQGNLPNDYETVKDIIAERDQLREQNKELVEALKMAIRSLDNATDQLGFRTDTPSKLGALLAKLRP